MSTLDWLGLYILIIAIIILAADLLYHYFNLKYYKSVESVFLEIKPPLDSGKTPLATEQLFNIIHALLSPLSFKERLRGRTTNISFEIASTRDEGIRFILRLPSNLVNNVKQQLASYLPNIQFSVVDDYLSENYEARFDSVNE